MQCFIKCGHWSRLWGRIKGRVDLLFYNLLKTVVLREISDPHISLSNLGLPFFAFPEWS